MKIVADEDIPLLKECFGDIGDIVTVSGRALTAADVCDADVLLVRSVTQVNESLVKNSALKFVATATAGADHVDQPLLAKLGIGFASAAGCNATAVSEYVLAALDILSEKYKFNLQRKTFGIVGKGQVGSRLVSILQGMGLSVLVSDPLCEKNTYDDGSKEIEFVSLSQLIKRCDVISIHVPLTIDGPYPTHHMIQESQLEAMRDGTVLISAGRGAVVDNQSLRQCLEAGKRLRVVIDVWEHEPIVDRRLLDLVDIATPHIAGHSLDGKIAGIEFIYRAFCKFFGVPARVRTAALTTMPMLRMMSFTENAKAESAASMAIRAVYDIRRDDSQMRQLLSMDVNEAALAFDQLRKNYPIRREFNTLKLKLKRCGDDAIQYLSALGFMLDSSDEMSKKQIAERREAREAVVDNNGKIHAFRPSSRKLHG